MQIMEYAKILYTDFGFYSCRDTSSADMEILGLFFTDNVGCRDSSFARWVVDDSLGFEVSGNSVCLAKEEDHILLSNLYAEEDNQVQLKMSRAQLVKLLDEWQEKVCKLKPKEVIVKFEDGEFSMETKD
jgi:hypothetical protein